ncbi:MAG: hypothetical protein AAFP03_18020, partial [Cyanobacteria bacterium J06598_3]
MTIYSSSTFGSVGAVRLRKTIARVPTRPWCTVVTLIVIDLLCVFVAGTASVLIRQALGAQLELIVYWRLWPIAVLFVMAYAVAKLYPGVA